MLSPYQNFLNPHQNKIAGRLPMRFVFCLVAFFCSFSLSQVIPKLTQTTFPLKPGTLSSAVANVSGFFPVIKNGTNCTVYSVPDSFYGQKIDSISNACIYDIEGSTQDTVEMFYNKTGDISTVHVGKDTVVKSRVSCLSVLPNAGIVFGGDTSGHIFTVGDPNNYENTIIDYNYGAKGFFLESVTEMNPYYGFLLASNGVTQEVLREDFSMSPYKLGFVIETAPGTQIYDIAVIGDILLVSEGNLVLRCTIKGNGTVVRDTQMAQGMRINHLFVDGNKIFATDSSTAFYLSTDTAATGSWTKINSSFDNNAFIVPKKIMSYSKVAYGFYYSSSDGMTHLATSPDTDWASTAIFNPRPYHRMSTLGSQQFINILGQHVLSRPNIVAIPLIK